MLSMIRLYLGQHSAAELHIRRAVEINPCDPDNLAYLGLVLAHRGRADEGVAIVAEAIRLNPGHPPWYFADMAMALRLAGRYREALVYAELIPAGSCWRELRIARCHAMLGHKADAARHMRKALALAPDGWDPARELGEGREIEGAEDRERLQKEISLAFAAMKHEATGR
jgi:Flp pilus assembly protein TadD